MLNQSARIISFSVEVIREEHVDLIDQQNLWALILIQVNLGCLSLELFLKDVGHENVTQLSFSVDLKFSHFVERSVLYQILETQSSEHWFETLVVSQTQVLAVAGALDFEAIKSEDHADNGECHWFTFSCLNLDEVISDITLLAKYLAPVLVELWSIVVLRFVSDTKNSQDRQNLGHVRLQQIALKIGLRGVHILRFLVMLRVHETPQGKDVGEKDGQVFVIFQWFTEFDLSENIIIEPFLWCPLGKGILDIGFDTR